MKNRIRLDTFTEVKEFVDICTLLDGKITVSSGDYKGNAKSLLNVMASLEWGKLYCESEKDIYSKIQKFVIADED